MFKFFGKKYLVKCPDGTTRIVYNKAEDVFPLHLTNTKKSVSSTVSGLESIKVQVKAEDDERLAALLTGVDKINRSMQAQFRAAYAVYEADPCSELGYLKKAIEKIIVDEQKLRSIDMIISQLCTLIAGRSKTQALDQGLTQLLDQSLTQALNCLLPPSAIEMTSEMKKVEDRTERWRDDV